MLLSRMLRLHPSWKPHIKAVIHLPLVHRLVHVKSRRHVIISMVGLSIMVTGSAIAHYEQDLVHNAIWDTFGYTIHAIGAIPVLRHFEPVWAIIIGEIVE